MDSVPIILPGKSAMTAEVLMTALASALARLAFILPPVEGFKPKIHTW